MAHVLDDLDPDDIVLDALPDTVIASLEVRQRWLDSLLTNDLALEFLFDDVSAWAAGQTVRVAFLGGDAALHRDLAETTRAITDACNIKLDFGLDAQGAYRTWSPQDTTHAAEIRVSFDQPGYFSLVGRDSSDVAVGIAGQPVGGRANQRSLNLGGYDSRRPEQWQGTVLHEFMHALAFHHEHQSPAGPCQEQFRWEDEPGYQPTLDRLGRFAADASGRRPGIYTYLAGYPNRWPRSKVDHNLKPGSAAVVAGAFDPTSVMLYRFPELFYRTNPSPCAPNGDGQSLSDGDRLGLTQLYPGGGSATEALRDRTDELLVRVEAAFDDGDTLESMPSDEPLQGTPETGGMYLDWIRGALRARGTVL